MFHILFASQWIRLLTALCAGIIGTFSYSPFGWWPCAFISFATLLYCLTDRSIKQSAAIGFIWGLGLYLSGIHWIYISIQQFGELPVIISALLVVLLASYLSLYALLFAVLLNTIWSKNSVTKFILAAPVLWAIVEYLRGHLFTGFPWLQFGYSQIAGPLSGIAPIAGVDGITLILTMLAGFISYSVYRKKIRFFVMAGLITLALLPLKSIRWYQEQPGRMINVALVQGNIAQSLKWSPNALYTNIEKYLTLTQPQLGNAKLIIWPEAAIPDIEQNQVDLLQQLDTILRRQHSILLTGIIDSRINEQAQKSYNTVITLGSKSAYTLQGSNRYHKQHLVIFGEYVPFADLLRPLAGFFDLPMSSLSQGDAHQSRIRADGYIITTAICYEVILGSLVRDNFRSDSDFLVTVSNDTWFGDSIGPWQHFEMARMRALELGRPMLRATNNGITAVINADGVVLAQLPQFTEGVLDFSIMPTTGMTPYAQWGNCLVWSCILLMLITALALRFIRAQ